MHQIGDRVTVLRDGEKIATVDAGTVSVDGLIRMMVGREITQKYHKGLVEPSAVALEACGLSRGGVLHDLSFSVRRGEILGIAGLVGSGRTELAQCLFGVDRIDAGEIRVDGQPTRLDSPRDAVTARDRTPHRGPEEAGPIPRHVACWRTSRSRR